MDKNIIAGNEIISKFIGIKYDAGKDLYIIDNSEYDNGYDDALIHLDKIANSTEIDSADDILLYFNSKWDLLMPVCKKWNCLHEKDMLVIYYYDEYEILCDKLDNLVSCYNITEAWTQLVENIKWYNSLK